MTLPVGQIVWHPLGPQIVRQAPDVGQFPDAHGLAPYDVFGLGQLPVAHGVEP
jgi:hypothetical protein